MAALRRAVVIALLAIWCFPAVSLAKSEPMRPLAPPTLPAATAPAADGNRPDTTSEAAALRARERQAGDLEDWRGGRGVFFYVGSGLLLILIAVLLLVLI